MEPFVFGIVFSAIFWTFWSLWCRNLVKKIDVKSWFLLFRLVFLLYIWIQRPKKPLRHFNFAILHITPLFSMNSCRILKILDRKIPSEKPSKSRAKDNSFVFIIETYYNMSVNVFFQYIKNNTIVFPSLHIIHGL